MPLNVGSAVSTGRASFGPGVVALGLAGSTPSDNVGLIGEDGVEIEFQSEMRDIVQGNPKIPIKSFAVAQNFFVRFTSIEWAAYRLAWALGTGATSVSGTNEVYRFGGGPCPTELALLLQHRKCTAAHTVNARLWKCTSETGSFSVQMGDDLHGFAFAFKGLRSATNWAGGSLASDSQLVEIDIELS
jgi:hypothetical protein